MSLLTPELAGAVRRAAALGAPYEVGGAITPEGLELLPNLDPHPDRHYRCDEARLLQLRSESRLLGLFHSHPNGPDCPSEMDMRAQLSWGIPFVICATFGTAALAPFEWGDIASQPPLLGRPFRHGVTDCYEIIRDWYYQERSITLPAIPRSWEWWNQGRNLYTELYSQAGFRRIDLSEVGVGDVALFSMRSTVPNHAGVLLENGLMIHHASGAAAHDPRSLSKRRPLAMYMPNFAMVLRHDA